MDITLLEKDSGTNVSFIVLPRLVCIIYGVFKKYKDHFKH